MVLVWEERISTHSLSPKVCLYEQILRHSGAGARAGSAATLSKKFWLEVGRENTHLGFWCKTDDMKNVGELWLEKEKGSPEANFTAIFSSFFFFSFPAWTEGWNEEEMQKNLHIYISLY